MSTNAGGASASNDGLGLEPERSLDESHWHEALDRASLFARMVDVDLLQLPAVQSDATIKAKVDQAASALAEAYQLIGLQRFKEPDA